ncbi:corrinoid protein [Bacilliculturomica massiliensis]|uniref:corrinoid protein n=1 Tax=Bacilliculturomica massiliensis TaxID=1917867 RepID=UPI001031BD27|nr:corrinoid protein [Bacilliculturomica massiliensis]
MSKLYKKMQEAVLEGDEDVVVELVQEAIDEGLNAEEILNDGLIEAMNEVAVLFRDGDMFVPEVLMSANAMQAGNGLLKPLLVQGVSEKKGRIVIGTVEGDLHDIGKKIVGMMLEGAGFEVIDLGMDVKPDRFIGALKETEATMLGMSAMLTTTMTVMPVVIERMKKEGFGHVKVMIGGAPVTDAYAQQIGAHYSYDASSAVELAKRLAEELKA